MICANAGLSESVSFWLAVYYNSYVENLFPTARKKIIRIKHMNSELTISLTHFPDETAKTSPEDL